MNAASNAKGWLSDLGLACVVSAVILVCFSPAWVSFVAWQRMPEQYWDLVPVRRGVAVMEQVHDPFGQIHDTFHSSTIRWRLLFPLVGHLLGVPAPIILLLSPLGCVVVLCFMIRNARLRGLPRIDQALLAVVAGSASWFFVATGWLGYFDSWLVLGLLAVAFARRQWIVLLACLSAPWIDERFVIAFPLAMLVRFLDRPSDDAGIGALIGWVRAEALAPAVVVSLIAALRIWLAGHGGSEDVATYLQRIAFLHLPVIRLLFGAWEGLRAGWGLVAAAVLLVARRGSPLGASLLALGVVMTTVLGFATANDLSRSAAAAIPVVPLGWQLARSTEAWRSWRIGWVLAAAALLLPAHHVVSDFTSPVNSLPHEIAVLRDSGLLQPR